MNITIRKYQVHTSIYHIFQTIRCGFFGISPVLLYIQTGDELKENSLAVIQYYRSHLFSWYGLHLEYAQSEVSLYYKQ